MVVSADKERIYITMPRELAQQVRELAAAEDRNFSNMVSYIVRKYLEDGKGRPAETSATDQKVKK